LVEEKEYNHELFRGGWRASQRTKPTHFVKEASPFKDDFGEGMGGEKGRDINGRSAWQTPRFG
jgi:hypothetical protein